MGRVCGGILFECMEYCCLCFVLGFYEFIWQRIFLLPTDKHSTDPQKEKWAVHSANRVIASEKTKDIWRKTVK
jgi:hypothetical protein